MAQGHSGINLSDPGLSFSREGKLHAADCPGVPPLRRLCLTGSLFKGPLGKANVDWRKMSASIKKDNDKSFLLHALYLFF